MEYRLSKHARDECQRRQIPFALVDAVLQAPEQVLPERLGRRSYQGRFVDGNQTFLLRVIVDDTVTPALIITVYRTSKVERYWDQQ